MIRSPTLMGCVAATVAILALRACEVASVEEDKPNIVLFLVDDMGLMDTSVPILGVCYGMQLLSQHFGGRVGDVQ